MDSTISQSAFIETLSRPLTSKRSAKTHRKPVAEASWVRSHIVNVIRCLRLTARKAAKSWPTWSPHRAPIRSRASIGLLATPSTINPPTSGESGPARELQANGVPDRVFRVRLYIQSKRMLRALPATVLLSLLSTSSPAQLFTSEVKPTSATGLMLEPTSLEFAVATASAAHANLSALRSAPITPKDRKLEKERVALTTADKVELHGEFYVPRSSDDRAPAVLLLHDAGSNGAQLTPIAEYLNKRGFGVLVLDLRGHGQSAAEGLNWANMEEEEQERVWALTLDDVQAGAAWLRKRRDIHASNLTVIGVRASCALAARHAVNDENARAAILIDPEPHSLGFDILRDLRSLGGLPTLILCEKKGRQKAVRMTEASHSANGGQEYIKVQYMKCKPEKLVTDRRAKSSLGSWLREQVMPRRGR